MPFLFLPLGLALAFFFLPAGLCFGLALLLGSAFLLFPLAFALVLPLPHRLVPGLGVDVSAGGPDQAPAAVTLAGGVPDPPVPGADPVGNRLPVQDPADKGGQLHVVDGDPGTVLEVEGGGPVDEGPRPMIPRLLDPDRRHVADPGRFPAGADPAHADAVGPVPLGALLDVLVGDR
ncbi:hypothetical protein JNW88_15955 [Micromonospora sp. ATA32]|nr:hypothetical protein [Micromonospora sp. ATA32]